METDATRVCELLVGIPDVNVLGVVDHTGMPILFHVETRGPRPCCPSCDGEVRVKDRPAVELVDLPCFGRTTRLVWLKHRWTCPNPSCPTGS